MEHRPDASWMQLGVQPVGDLLGEPFLDLRLCGEVLDEPGELGQSEDPRARGVTARDATRKRRPLPEV